MFPLLDAIYDPTPYSLFLAISTSFALFATFLVLGHVVYYFIDPQAIKANGIPGPFLAKFSDIWLAYHAAMGNRSEVVHAMHLKYGTRISSESCPHTRTQ